MTTFKSNAFRVLCILAVSLLYTTSMRSAAAETLGEILEKSSWSKIIGTWVDQDTKGDTVKTTYAWKIKDRVIEVTTQQGEVESVGLIGVNGKTGDVFYMGADSTGSSSIGQWTVEDNGDAVLGMLYTSGDGQEGSMNIRHHREDNDTMTVTVELPNPVVIKLIRSEK